MGGVAIILAVLIVALVPLFFKDKSVPISTESLSPQAKLEKEKVQKEQDRLIEASKQQQNSFPSADELKKDADKLIEEAKSNEVGKSQEEIQKDQNALISAAKK